MVLLLGLSMMMGRLVVLMELGVAVVLGMDVVGGTCRGGHGAPAQDVLDKEGRSAGGGGRAGVLLGLLLAGRLHGRRSPERPHDESCGETGGLAFLILFVFFFY